MPRLLSKRLIPWFIALAGFGVAIVAWIALQRIESAESRSELVVIVKADGSFYLPSEPTIPVTRELLKALLDTANPRHCVIAIDNSCPVNAIGPVINATAEAGFAHYQLRTPESRLNFSLQLCSHCLPLSDSVQRWVDLRENATDRIFDEPDRPDESDDIKPSTEVAVLTDPGLPVGELLKESAPYAVPGKSMEIQVFGRYPDGVIDLETTLLLLRYPQEDQAHRYIPPPPGPFAEWTMKCWKATKDTVNSWF
jgi:hypothetical protein